MINAKKNLCCGCGACYNICPQQAIKMKPDSKGFKYPVVDEKKCTNCGLCEKTCEKINKDIIKNVVAAYACYNKDLKTRLESSSGGIFSLIAEYILDNNGIVFGASFNEKFEVNHILIENKSQLYRLRSSKYVQSNINNTYREAKSYLEKGKLVLFTGTPCQINGLNKFLDKKYKNLLLQDIICHGVPSPKVWEEYLKYRKEKEKKEIKKVNFRQKDSGWRDYEMVISYANEEYRKNHNKDMFMNLFLRNTSLRESCYNCQSKGNNRFSDITLADFWGVNNVIEEMNDNKGVSFVIINTLKGAEFFEKIKDKIVYKQVNYSEGIKYNPSYYQSAQKPKLVNEFFENLEKMDFNKLVKKYTTVEKESIIKRIFRKCKKIIQNIIKK